MFATLLGALPRPPVPPDADEGALVDAAVAAQVEAGLEPVTDAGWWGDRPPVDAWLETSRRTDRIVKQAVVGPLSAPSPGLEEARAVNAMVRALADAGWRQGT